MIAFLKGIAIYNLIMIIVGTIGNFLIFYVGLALRNNNTFLFLAFLSISDFVSLYWWNLNHFVQPFFGIDLQNFNVVYCKIMQFFQFTSFQLSGWFLVLISFERYFSVVINNWRTIYFKPNRALLIAIITTIVVMGINFHVLITFAHVRIRNETLIENNVTRYIQVESVECYSTEDTPSSKIMLYWETVHSCLYSYIPFALILISNFLLIYTISKKKQTTGTGSASQEKKQRSMNITVIVITVLFIVMTLPGTIVSIYYDFLLQSSTGEIILYLGDSFDITYHALNFIILFISNKKFYSEIKGIFVKDLRRKNAVNNTSSTNPTR